nr:DUF4153 domain-containing protein [Aureimonas sp. AU4]
MRALAAAVVDLVRRATSRFPVTTALVVLFGTLAVAEQLDLTGDALSTARLLVALSGAAAASLAGHLLTEGRLASAVLRILTSAGLAAMAGSALWLAEPFELYGPILIATCVGAVPVVGMAGRGSAADFWGFVLWTTAGIVLAFLAVVVFSVGVYAILQMLEYLLDVPRFQRIESAVWVAAISLVGPLVALGRVPPTSGPEIAFDPQERFVRTTRPLADWVLAPLVLAAAAVIHLYAARIALTGDVPKGQIGWIVSAYLLAVLLMRIAIDPFAAQEAAPARLFRRLWSWFLVVPLGLLAYALWLRVATEGVTVSRYVLGLWLVAGVLALAAQAVPRWRGDIRILSAIPLGLLLLSTFGPWGVAATVTGSQLAFLDRDYGPLLREAGRGGGAPAGASSVISSRLEALESVGALRRVAGLVSAERQSDPIWSRPNLLTWDVVAFLALEPQPPEPPRARYFVARSGDALDTSGFDRVVFRDAQDPGAPLASVDIRLTQGRSELAIRIGSLTDTLDLAPILATLPWTDERGVATATPAVADLTTAGGRHMRVRVERANLVLDDRLVALAAAYLWRDAEWRAATPPR